MSINFAFRFMMCLYAIPAVLTEMTYTCHMLPLLARGDERGLAP